ncbi:MAG: helix-turn-helix transcriptional regulator [Treponema sp.]|nr:helix-turn-helix transcriptional regulator [Treponema sp.]
MKAKNHFLTAREHEILNLILDGISLKEIAARLGVSYKAIDYHRGNLYQKYGVQSMQELIVMRSAAIEMEPQNISLPENFFTAVYKNWITYSDNTSSSNILIKSKTKKNQKINTFIMSGSQGKKNGSNAGIYGFPDFETCKAMKTMSMFSFNIKGDGNDYLAMLPTKDTVDGDHYFKKFSTQKNKIMTITVNISNELTRWGWSGVPCEFIQENIMYLQFQAESKGAFNLEIWDIRLYT